MSWQQPFINKSKIRAEVWDKTGGKCYYCGKQTNPFKDFCIDYIIDGIDAINNVVPCCKICNTRKSNKGYEYLRRWYPTFYFERIGLDE